MILDCKGYKIDNKQDSVQCMHALTACRYMHRDYIRL